jgi:hypothetical protein
MIAMLIAIVASGNPIDRCADAVHHDLRAIAAACTPSPVELWRGPRASKSCDAALSVGRSLGRSGQADHVIRASLVADFERRLATCRKTVPVTTSDDEKTDIIR